ncbi:MAG: hypothetical protein RJR34_12900 [Candidatus Methanoculleus thermohydrogenotrophicum]|nr:hypothetical protein [Candidatus Methanoculleus thermohydrogenotrophicum]
MTVKLNAKGYEALRERTPVIEWYAELQTADGTPVCDRFALATHRTSAENVTPMTFSFPITGADCVSLPSQIEQVQLFEAATGEIRSPTPRVSNPFSCSSRGMPGPWC